MPWQPQIMSIYMHVWTNSLLINKEEEKKWLKNRAREHCLCHTHNRAFSPKVSIKDWIKKIIHFLCFLFSPFLFDLAVVLEGSLADVSYITAGLDFTHGEHNFCFVLSNQICSVCLLQPDLIKCPCCSALGQEEVQKGKVWTQHLRLCRDPGNVTRRWEGVPFHHFVTSPLPSTTKELLLPPEMSTILQCKHPDWQTFLTSLCWLDEMLLTINALKSTLENEMVSPFNSLQEGLWEGLLGKTGWSSFNFGLGFCCVVALQNFLTLHRTEKISIIL